MEQRDAIRLKMSVEKLSYTWLIRQLERNGIVVAKSELSSILAGTRPGPKSDQVINTITKILSDYDRVFLKKNDGH